MPANPLRPAAALLLVSMSAACTSPPASRSPATPEPPKAAQVPHVVESPNGSRSDPYDWLRDDDPKAKRPEVMAYLKAENDYADAVLAPTLPLQKTLVAEMRSRIQEDDSSAPLFENGWWTYRRFREGSEYPVYLRRKATMEAPEEVVLDVPALAAGKPFYRLANHETSPDNRLVAFADDAQGRRIHTLRFRDLQTGRLLPDAIPGVMEDIAWAADSRTVFYVKQDPLLLQLGPVWRHAVGTPASDDRLVYDEPDKSFFVGLGHTASREFVTIHLGAENQDEWRVIPADDPLAEPRVLIPRSEGHEHTADHVAGRWFLRTNEGARDFRIVEAAAAAPADRTRWRDVVPTRDGIAIDGFALFEGGIAVNERKRANLSIAVLGLDGRPRFSVQADEPAFDMQLDANPEAGARAVRYRYESLIAPAAVYEADLATGERRLLRRQAVPGYDPSEYASERLWAPSADGRVQIPVSIVYRKQGFARDGTHPMLIEGYGSYGISYDADFAASRLSLLDRGFVYAIAHVRGGADLGRAWYDDGRLFAKRHSFDDFVSATDFLVNEKIAARAAVFAAGRSAGGLLMGAVVNQAGDRYRGVMLGVPFVDVVTTMLDETIPLTTNEFTQWGNPKAKADYDYMLSYSPYDQLKRGPYPAMLVATALWDSQVQYFEPAKYVARLRTLKTDDRPLLLHTDLAASHGGRSGRFDRLGDTAREYAFFLAQLGRLE